MGFAAGLCSGWGVRPSEAQTPPGPPITQDAYITPGRASTVVLDTATNSLVNTVTVGINPFGVAVSPDGRYAYVTNFSSGTVPVIDAATHTVTATIGLTSGGGMTAPTGVAVTPDGRDAYVIDDSSATIAVVTRVWNLVEPAVPPGQRSLKHPGNGWSAALLQITCKMAAALYALRREVCVADLLLPSIFEAPWPGGDQL